MRDHSEAITELSALLGERLATSAADLTLHGQNETYYPNTPPDAVAYPETTEEVSQILKICHAQECPTPAVCLAPDVQLPVGIP